MIKEKHDIFQNDIQIINKFKPFFQKFKEISIDQSKLEPKEITKFYITISQNYQDVMQLQIKNYFESEINEEDASRLITYQNIFKASHIVYIKKRNPKAKELIDILIQYMDQDFGDKIDLISQVGEEMFRYSSKWTKIDANSLETIEKFFGFNKGNILSEFKNENIFELLLIAQKSDLIIALLSYLSEWIEHIYSNLTLTKNQRKRMEDVKKDAGFMENMPQETKLQEEKPTRPFDEFINLLRMELKQILTFMENRREWSSQYENKKEYSKAKKGFINQFYINHKQALELSQKIKLLEEEDFDYTNNGQYKQESMSKLLRDLNSFLLVLSGNVDNEDSQENSYIIQRFKSDPLKMIIAFLSCVNPLLEENKSEDFLRQVTINGLNFDFEDDFLLSLVHMIKGKSDAHHMVQFLISRNYIVLAFFIV